MALNHPSGRKPSRSNIHSQFKKLRGGIGRE
jgi:hypothetical protein